MFFRLRFGNFAASLLGLLPLCIGAPGNICAQTGTVEFEHISVDQGLSQSSGTAILQDSRGFIWIGTQDGLNKFDGIDFIIYYHDPQDSTSIGANTVRALCEDSSGNIWVSMEGGRLDKLEVDQGIFHHYGEALTASVGAESNTVRDMLVDDYGVLWLASRHGLVKFISKTNTFRHFQPGGVGPNLRWMTSLAVGESGQILVSTATRLLAFDYRRETFSELPLRNRNGDVVLPTFISKIRRDSRGAVWIVAFPYGLLRLYSGSNTVAIFSHDPNDAASLSSTAITDLVEDKQGYLWVATENRGLNRAPIASLHSSGKTSVFTQYRNDPLEPASLRNDAVSSLHIDDSGTLWAGTSGGGISKYDPDKIKFIHYKNTSGLSGALRGNLVWSIFEDSAGMLWIGTGGEGLNTFDRTQNDHLTFTHDPADPASLPGNSVFSIIEDRDGAIWVGTDGGLGRFDRKTAAFQSHEIGNSSAETWLDTQVRTLFIDSDERLWIGTTGQGLNRFVPESESFERYMNEPGNSSSIAGNTVLAIAEDQQGYLWLATSAGGLNRFDRKTATFTRYRHDPEDSNSLSINYALSLAIDAAGIIWVGTYYGLNKLDPATGMFQNYTTRHGLPNNVIYGILVDDKQNIWASSNRGLSRLDTRTGMLRNFTIDDGLQSSEFNTGAYFKSTSGEMFFGGVNGFNAFHPDSVRDNQYIPPVVIAGVKRFDQRVDWTASDGRPLQFSYRDNFITFEYSALDYTNPLRNQYAYKLAGLHDDWIYCENKRAATFTNLQPGEYVFHVKGTNSDGIWNETGTSLHFVVTPPFWQTWWFRWLAATTAMSLAILFVIRLKEKEKKKASLERKFSELKLKALRAQMNPHFVFNTINSIQYYISSNEPKSAYRYLSKFSKLIRKILDNSEKSSLTISEELDALRLYLELEKLRFEGKFNYTLEIDPAIDVHNMEIPTLLIQPFVENAIQHGLRFKRTKGALNVRLSLADGAIECWIEDNGIGIEKSLENKGKHKAGHHSTGMKVSQERLKTLNAIRRNGRGIEVIDLAGQDHKASGTRVKIVIPIENEYTKRPGEK